MQKWYEDESPDMFSPEPLNRLLRGTDWDLHVPISVAGLEEWEAEIPFHGNSDYGKVLKRDLALAKEATLRKTRILIKIN